MRIVRWLRENVLSLSIFLFTVIYVLIYSLWCEPGISPDSTNYLREARALLSGYGLNNDAGAGVSGFYGIWPIGYSALIALVSFVTRLNVFYSAKLITVGILGATTYMFITRFGKNSWIYLLLMCNPGYVSCMRHVSSENLFFFAVMWFGFCLYDVWEGKISENKACIKLGIVSLLAILSRWVGAFTLAPIGLLAVMTFFGIGVAKNRKRAYKIGAVAVVNGLLLMAYLLYIKSVTGYMTGMYRIPSLESKKGLLKQLIIAEDIELYNAMWGLATFNYKITAVVILLILTFIGYKIYKGGLEHKLPICFVVTCIVYWCGYVYTRFRTDMEIFNHRVLLPATLTLFVTFVYCLMENKGFCEFVTGISRSWWKKSIAVIVIFILCFHLQLDSWQMMLDGNTYDKMADCIEEYYSDVPSGSLVITEDWDINFLRMDLVRCTVNDCDSNMLGDIMYQLEVDEFENIYVQKFYLEYLFMLEESDDSYGELRKYLASEEYLIKLR